MIRWTQVGQWISVDNDCQNIVISTLCRGITMLEKENKFSLISPLHQSENPTSNTVLLLAPSPAVVQPQISEKIIKKPVKSSMKLFDQIKAHSRGSTLNTSLNNGPSSTLLPAVTAVCTGIQDSGLGLPTFAKVSAGIAVAAAAENSMALLANFLGNFPPLGERIGVSCKSSLWREDVAVTEMLIDRREFCISRGEDLSPINSVALDYTSLPISEYRKFIRYYAFDNNVVIGVVELPSWHLEIVSGQKEPNVVLVLRDANGKSTWLTSSKYMDINLKPKDAESAVVSPVNGEMGAVDYLDETPNFSPVKMPYVPANSKVLRKTAIEEENILPSVGKMFESSSESYKAFCLIKDQVDSEIIAEDLSYKKLYFKT